MADNRNSARPSQGEKVEGYNEGCSVWGFPGGSFKADSEAEIQKLYQNMECCVCHEFPKTPSVLTCQQNHLFCQTCVPQSKSCPQCRSSISDASVDGVENCISNLVLPCRYKFQGCQELLRGNSIRGHLPSCTYRPVACFMSKCGSKNVPFKELFNHLRSSHGQKVNGIENSNTHIVEWWIQGDSNATARWPPFYLTAYNNVFLYMCVSTIHGTWEWVWILASSGEASRFMVEMRMESMESGLSVHWKGPVHPIRKTVKEIIASGQVFVTNSKEIRNPFLYKKSNDKTAYWRTELSIQQIAPPSPLTSVPYLMTNDPSKDSVSSPQDSWFYSTKRNSLKSTRGTLPTSFSSGPTEPVALARTPSHDTRPMSNSIVARDPSIKDSEQPSSLEGEPPRPSQENRMSQREAETVVEERRETVQGDDEPLPAHASKTHFAEDPEPEPSSKVKKERLTESHQRIVEGEVDNILYQGMEIASANASTPAPVKDAIPNQDAQVSSPVEDEIPDEDTRDFSPAQDEIPDEDAQVSLPTEDEIPEEGAQESLPTEDEIPEAGPRVSSPAEDEIIDED